uniref:Uncharacterized protein n=1 Tax=Amphimedon queenslandica TaxID=400682 RepID=A0A1X7V7L9_AMPQE
MVKKSSRIFRSKFGDISGRIDNPGPIAEQLFGKGLIGKASLDRALMNNVVAFERMGPLLRAVYAAVDTDTEEPVMFNKLCDVLMSFSETEAIGIAMYTEYHGVSPRSPPPPPPPPPPQRSVSFKIEGEDFTDDHEPSVTPPSGPFPSLSHSSFVEQETTEAVVSDPPLPEGDITIPTPFGPMIIPIHAFTTFSTRHPWLARGSLLIAAGLLAYGGFRMIKKYTS